MSLAPRLDLRQSQSLVMTPQLQQAIKLLALSNLEIETFIAEELEKNPLLDAGGGDEREPVEAAEAEPLPERDGPADSTELLDGGDGTGEASLDVDFTAETFHHDSAADSVGGLDGGLGLAGTGGGGLGEDGPDFDSFCAHRSQSSRSPACASRRRGGRRGPVHCPAPDRPDRRGRVSHRLAARHRQPARRAARAGRGGTGTDPDTRPHRRGARDLAECLALQAKEADRYDPCMAALMPISICLRAGTGTAQAHLRGLGGRAQQRDAAAGPGQPRLLCRGIRRAAGQVEQGLALRHARQRQLAGQGARQRQRTIIKVASEIVKQQEAFFRHGVSHLRRSRCARSPTRSRCNESTVSRVTSNKYLSCARGLFELKYFFTSAIQSADGGDAVSAEAVKSAIRALIQAEDPRKILSDDTLVEMLNSKGFDIARRTVAKYREAMGIGSSVQRRRQKALEGAS
ncbi:sigma-54, DNA binding domain-containing protein [Ditylenchus destructor]|uniref:Sigma-54, DNA binding domain-containing protein n=1 Tax=Ditylenchus destructor TaxID=166010 RepID=A0AAD4MGB2_9BILA|nr:sigma-54, DNA binding domain-containing protein [Ditylenchus destructor]